MFARSNLYSLDIETDTATGGLDPATSAITEISISTEYGDQVFSGNEEHIISELAGALYDLPAGLIFTWNGAFFDLPYIWSRAQRHPELSGAGLTLMPAGGLQPKYDLLPGWDEAQSGLWACRNTVSLKPGFHQTLDVAFAYRAVAETLGVPWSLKPVCKALGIYMVEVDRARMHELTAEERAQYAASDAHGTRELGIKLLGA